LGLAAALELNRGLGDVGVLAQVGSISGILGRAPDPNEGIGFYLYDKEGRITTARRYTLAGKEALAEERKFDANTNRKNLPAATEFYIERLEAQRPARVRPLEEVRDIIDKELLAQERARLQGKWIDRLQGQGVRPVFLRLAHDAAAGHRAGRSAGHRSGGDAQGAGGAPP
jgi:hypothetical protein